MSLNLVRRKRSPKGQTLVEYALILAFIAIVAVAVMLALGQNVKKPYDKATDILSSAQASH